MKDREGHKKDEEHAEPGRSKYMLVCRWECKNAWIQGRDMLGSR
jgi:hypothetical protein